MGKCRASPEPCASLMTCKPWDWKSTLDSNAAEDRSLSDSSQKQQRCEIAAPELPSRGIIPFSDSEHVKSRPGHKLPLVGFTRHGEQGPQPLLSTAPINVAIPTMLTISPWGRGDPPASILVKLPYPLWKSRADKEHGTRCATTRIPKHSTDCKSTLALRTFQQITCNSQLYDES